MHLPPLDQLATEAGFVPLHLPPLVLSVFPGC